MHERYCLTILYVDPYDFGTVQIDKVKSFVAQHYCELIFNFFISDYVRNGIDERIEKCISDLTGNLEITNKDELIRLITQNLKVGDMKYLFSYQFKIITNTELYQIIFVTPHKRGLEVLKDALWTIFNGKFYHRNTNKPLQMTMLSEDIQKDLLLQQHSKEAEKILIDTFYSQSISYEAIELLLIENTMLSSNHIIKYVLVPLIETKKILKKGNVSNSRNYKNDYYDILVNE